MKKRILSILLTFCMVMGLVPITVFAEDTRYGVWIMGEEITSSRKTSGRAGNLTRTPTR